MKHIPFRSIEQYRHIVSLVKRASEFKGFDENNKPIYEYSVLKPTIEFTGTIKTHGTCSMVVGYQDKIWHQSREQLLDINIGKDNAGFSFFATSREEVFKSMINKIREAESIPDNFAVMIAGEFVGKGIQKSVGVANLLKTFIIFDIKITNMNDLNESYYLSHENSIFSQLHNLKENIWNILQFPTFTLNIDFNTPELFQNSIIEATTKVADYCPVAKQIMEYQGIEITPDLNMIGEGIVWRGTYKDMDLIFKSKDERHANGSKITKLRVVDEEKINLKLKVANEVTPIWRLEQMFESTFDTINGGQIERSKIGEFIKKVINDIIKEDIDILKENNLEIDDIGKYVSDIVRKYYFEKEKI